MSAALKHRVIDYPTRDGKPMAETEIHRDVMIDTILTLAKHNRRWYVSGNMLLYYVEGDPRRHVSPDVFVVRGIPRHKRDYFLMWDERKGPEFVIEVTSKSTKKEDLKAKFDLYERTLQVREYVLFDPRAEYLHPPLQGYRLIDGKYHNIELAEGRLPSAVLGLHLEAQGHQLRFYDPKLGRWLPTIAETADALVRTEEALTQTADALTEAQARIKKLEAELRQARSEKA